MNSWIFITTKPENYGTIYMELKRIYKNVIKVRGIWDFILELNVSDPHKELQLVKEMDGIIGTQILVEIK